MKKYNLVDQVKSNCVYFFQQSTLLSLRTLWVLLRLSLGIEWRVVSFIQSINMNEKIVWKAATYYRYEREQHGQLQRTTCPECGFLFVGVLWCINPKIDGLESRTDLQNIVSNALTFFFRLGLFLHHDIRLYQKRESSVEKRESSVSMDRMIGQRRAVVKPSNLGDKYWTGQDSALPKHDHHAK